MTVQMRKILLFLVIMVVMIFLTAAELPSSLYKAMDTMKNEDVLCVKNYNAGASFTESYTDFQSLDKDTVVVSRSGENNSSNAVLQASINSLVVGNAYLGWQSVNPYQDIKGRHAVFSRNEENLTGAFSIEKFIQLAFNGTLGGTSEWLPCS